MTDRSDAERKKRIQSYLHQYRKNVAKKDSSVLVGFGSDLPPEALEVKLHPIGVHSIDSNLGGIPLGGGITVAGAPSVGKSTLALVIAAALQKSGKLVALLDAEHTFDASWARKQGVNVDDLLLVQAETLEDTLNIAVDTIRAHDVDYAILDSIDATVARGSMTTKKGKQRDLDDDDIALKARQFSRFFPRIVHALRTNNAGLMLIGQYRTSNIGTGWVNTRHISGGRARSFYDWLTLDLRKGSHSTWIKDDATGKIIGFPFTVNVSKSKLSTVREGHEFNTMFFYDKGFDDEFEKIQLAYQKGVIEKKSQQSHLYVDTAGVEHKIPFGKEYKAITWLIENGLAADVWEKYKESENV